MGQCVLRDFGCDFEKDQEKKKVLNDFLKEKLAAKYPEDNRMKKQRSYTPQKSKSDKTYYTPKKSDPLEIYQDDYAHLRLSRAGRKTAMKETMVQTEVGDDNNLRKSQLKSYENTVFNESKTPNENKSNVLNYSQNLASSAETSNVGGLYDSPAQLTKSRLNTPLVKSEYKIKVSEAPLRGTRTQSENPGGLNGMGRSTANTQSNIFNGIERIDFKDPSKSQTIRTGRSKNHMIKGFENKFFKITKNRSPSPTAEDQKILDEDDYQPDDY